MGDIASLTWWFLLAAAPLHIGTTLRSSFTVVEGEIEATFRGKKSVVRTGETVNIPANAPHSFTNASQESARLLCICSPAGQEELFLAIGVRVATRTTPPPKPDEAVAAEMKSKIAALLPKFRTVMV
jgi:uncharacterized cupin superfamily protein